MKLREIFKPLFSNNIIVTEELAQIFTNLVASIQEKYGFNKNYSIYNHKLYLEILQEYKKLIKTQVPLEKIVEIAESYDLWNCDFDKFYEIRGQLYFINTVIDIFYHRDSLINKIK